MPCTERMPPPNRAGPQVVALPSPRPPTMSGVAPPPPPPPRPPPPPPPPAAGAAAAAPPPAGPVPFGPHPVVSVVFTHLRLRFLTVVVLTCLRALYRLPLKSPEYVRHS